MPDDRAPINNKKHAKDRIYNYNLDIETNDLDKNNVIACNNLYFHF